MYTHQCKRLCSAHVFSILSYKAGVRNTESALIHCTVITWLLPDTHWNHVDKIIMTQTLHLTPNRYCLVSFLSTAVRDVTPILSHHIVNSLRWSNYREQWIYFDSQRYLWCSFYTLVSIYGPVFYNVSSLQVVTGALVGSIQAVRRVCNLQTGNGCTSKEPFIFYPMPTPNDTISSCNLNYR